jgi:hypothetical protein
MKKIIFFLNKNFPMHSVLSIGVNDEFLREISWHIMIQRYDSVREHHKIINPLFMNRKYSWCAGPGPGIISGLDRTGMNNVLDNMGKHADHLFFYQETEKTDAFWEERWMTRDFMHLRDMTNWIRALPDLPDYYKKIMIFKKNIDKPVR